MSETTCLPGKLEIWTWTVTTTENKFNFIEQV